MWVPRFKLCMLLSVSLAFNIVLADTAVSSAISEAAVELNAEQIMQKTYQLDRGKDAVARLKFTLQQAGQEDKNIILAMAWKNFINEKGVNSELDSKLLMFNEFPPDKKDIGFLGWIYRPVLGKQDDMWLYLPELRSVRRMSHLHGPHSHHHEPQKNTELFASSLLQRDELTQRPPELDLHTLLGRETLAGQTVYVIESRPREASSWKYSKSVSWITELDFLPLQVDYYSVSHHQHTSKRVTLQWQLLDGVWLWRSVEAVDEQSGQRTLLEQTDIKVNIGLADRLFTERGLRQGASRLRSQYGL